jgi:hypothetical protein
LLRGEQQNQLTQQTQLTQERQPCTGVNIVAE